MEKEGCLAHSHIEKCQPPGCSGDFINELTQSDDAEHSVAQHQTIYLIIFNNRRTQLPVTLQNAVPSLAYTTWRTPLHDLPRQTETIRQQSGHSGAGGAVSTDR